MKKLTHIIIIASTISIMLSCTSKQERMENKLKVFISSYEAKMIPLYKEKALTSWNANISGTDSDYALSEKASFEYDKIFTDTKAFAELKEVKESGAVQDPVLARELDLIYNEYLGNQVDTGILDEYNSA